MKRWEDGRLICESTLGIDYAQGDNIVKDMIRRNAPAPIVCEESVPLKDRIKSFLGWSAFVIGTVATFVVTTYAYFVIL